MKNESAIRKQLLALKTAILSDALGKTGAMDHDMHCFSANHRMAGPAVTLRIHTADILMIGKTLSSCPKGSVLVIDGQGELNTALWGGATTTCARLKGLAGVVIDGAIRDVAVIRRDRFPVFARAVVPNAGGAEYAGEMNVPVQCGGMVVNPGDWVVGDEDGVVVVPVARLTAVIETGVRLVEVENKIDRAIRSGKDLGSILRYDEKLARKSKEAFLPQMRFLDDTNL
ncbi:MAG: RraA family protein [Verrucomicrobia bacterium]|nr:RraA family protein [Verrucomicrobiota bacterium]